MPVYEDVFHYLWKEQRLPTNVSPLDSKLKDAEERVRLARVFERGVNEPVGFIMPLKRQWWQAKARTSPWTSGPWPVRPEKMFLLPGDSPVGLRLPLPALPHVPTGAAPTFYPVDPMAERAPLADRVQHFVEGYPEAVPIQGISEQPPVVSESDTAETDDVAPENVIRTALCVEPRDGRLYVFMPPVERLEDYLDLLAAVEETAEQLKMPVVVEGYLPPHDPRLRMIKVTPDPGVIEVNVHPASDWDELVHTTSTLYEDARLTRLGSEKFDVDGKHTGTGGGNHVVIGGETPADSPFLRRPDLLRSLVGYWNNHPSLSYLFSGRFIGPTSQAPRFDEGRADSIYEMQLAFSLVPERGNDCPPWLVDRIFRNLLVDLTGNTHRAEFCIDKMFSPDSSTGRLGLVEFRGFEMPPHAQMSLTQQLLIRSLVAWFWDEPYRGRLVEWGTALHDRFMLPHFVAEDFADVIGDLNRAGIAMDPSWFAAHHEFRFPLLGRIHRDDITVEIHQAIEPWYVLGEEPLGGGTARCVDSSVERLQVLVTGMTDSRHIVTCNGRRVPLRTTGEVGEFVAGVRYRAWQPPSCLHPTIPVHTPLVFDILDTWNQRSLGGCRYHVAHPGGLSHETFPVNSYEAEGRRGSRFEDMGHTVGSMSIPPEERNPRFPLTLDLRRNFSG